jgi:hypothetical protein
MRILVGCEESGKTRDAFAKLGHDAWSCDLQPSRHPGNHIKLDIFEAIKHLGPWDIIILHPPCDFLTVAGNRWYADSEQREKALQWTNKLWQCAKTYARVGAALENPIGVLPRVIGKPSQYIHPWQFGHGETKKTCLWLFNLPNLKQTNVVEGRENRVWKMPPGENRKRDRSETYQGWANAMADQWGVA